MKRIAFLWDWRNDPVQCMTWKDGLSRAMFILSKRYEVRMFTLGDRECVYSHEYHDFYQYIGDDRSPSESVVKAIANYKPDVILCFGDMTRPNAKPLAKLGIPMALCFAGGNTQAENWLRFSHIFLENQEYKDRFDAQADIPCTIAFGANTDLFTPLDGAVRTIDAFFPAVFADWKRHDLFTRATKGLVAICSGFTQPVSEQYCWKVPMESGVVVMHHTSPETVRMLMAQSKCVLITSKNVGGSQRTVLEALAMNTPVIVMSDNLKCCEYLKDVGCEDWIVDPEPDKIRAKILEVQPRNTRDKMMEKWSAEAYADNVESGIIKLLED